jgi:pyruvate formate lyase activating enzyme
MAQSLVSSRYALHVTRDGARETSCHMAYTDLYESDLVEEASGSGDEQLGYVHSIEVGSTVDGPGIRFVLFVTGCLLRCQYCHNPDTWHKRNGRPTTIKRITAEIGKYEKVLKISGGGLTISGGEPVQQRNFTTAIFRYAKSHGIHTCLDTSGRLGERLSDADLMDIDLNLLDIKSGDEETYRKVTGQPLQPTLDYALRLSRLGRPMWVRYVLVPGLTDAYDNVERVADFCAGLKTIERVEILRFHQMGAEKWTKLGVDYPLAATSSPTPELAERVRNQFRSRGLTVF